MRHRALQRSTRRLDKQINIAIRSIRQHLDVERVMRATLDAVLRRVPRARTTVWSVDQPSPRLLYPPALRMTDVPDAVRASIRRSRAVEHANSFAIPLSAPERGAIAILHVEAPSLDVDDHEFLESIAMEAGFALGAAELFERTIAEKEKSEAIIDRVADGVVVTDGAGRIVQWNPAAERILGSPASSVIGTPCHFAIGLLDSGGEALDCSKGCPLLMRDGHDGFGLEMKRPRPDGRPQPLLVSAARVPGPGGDSRETVHSIRDLTRLKEAEEAKTMFLATASHELKTPLTVIQGFAQTMIVKPDWGASERTKALETIVRRVRDLNRIVDRLLLSSRIEAGRIEISPSVRPIGPLLVERAEALQAASRRTIRTLVDPALPHAYAEEEALATVLDHLLDNAIKYSPDGGPVTLDAHFDDELVHVSIADQGIGMDPEQIAHCFERFWQAESSDVRRFGGTGIGLYIVRSLVEAMGASIAVESKRGGGTTFSFSLQRRGPVQAEPDLPVTEGGAGEMSITREFMRQIGIPTRRSA